MAELTISIEPDEFLGLIAVGELEETARSASSTGVEGLTKLLMRKGLAARLDELGLPWAPSAGVVAQRAAKAAEARAAEARAARAEAARAEAARAEAARAEAAQAEAARAEVALVALMRNQRVRRYAVSALAVAVAVTLWGGYVVGWSWTGFRANEQLWDWLHLLLLPIIAGTIPLWIDHPDYLSRARRRLYMALAAAFIVFVIVGYQVPLGWTGFPGNTLWNWLELIMLPLAVASVRLVPAAIRWCRPYHNHLLAAVVLFWTITIIGGYGLSWSWTGYQGNTLWDWLGLLLLPLVVPTLLVPTALRWVSNRADQRTPQASHAAAAGDARAAGHAPAASHAPAPVRSGPATAGSPPRTDHSPAPRPGPRPR